MKSKWFAIAVLGATAAGARGQLTGTLGAHDPSTLIKDGSTYRYFATGNGIISRRSTNMTSWSSGQSVFSSPPAWTTAAVPGFTGNFWAPDVAFFNGKYHLYYSASTFGSQVSAIGLATNPTLDPASSNYAWTDQGAVIQSQVGSAYNTIDPAIFKDSNGRIWMSFGSFWDGIFLTELDPSTGKRLGTGASPTRLADKSEIEAAFIQKRDGYYYLFVNWGFCCQGVNSTYNIRMGRSTNIQGPYVDKNGANLVSGGGSLFLTTVGSQIGPGHMGIFTEGEQDWFSNHFYNGNSNGAATYNLRQLYWESTGWPSATPISPNWTGATNGNWSGTGNWSGGIPDGSGHTANFNAIATGNLSVAVDGAPRTVGALGFNNAANYTIGTVGGNSMILQTTSGNAAISVLAGSHTIAAPVTLNDDLSVNVSPIDSTLFMTGPLSATDRTITKVGLGGVQFENVRAAALIVSAGKVRVSAKLQPNDASGQSSVNTLSIAGGAQLDLTNNSLVIDYNGPIGSLLTDVRQYLQNGMLVSSGADTSRGLGYVDRGESGVEIRFAFFGDSNLDGVVDVADLGALATAWQTAGSWSSGDFDYNGFVDVADLGVLATNWQGPPLGGALAALGLPSVAVPEPAVAGSMLVLICAGIGRLRGQNSPVVR